MTALGDHGVEALIDAYRDSLIAAGMFAGHPVISVARSFLARIGLEGWERLSLTEQCAQPRKNRRVIGWAMVTGRLAASADYLVRSHLNVGDFASRHHPQFFSRFCATAAELGFDSRSVGLQWSKLVKIAVIHGVAPQRVTGDQLVAGRSALLDAAARQTPGTHAAKVITKDVFGIEATLFHLGVIDEPPTRVRHTKEAERAAQWASVAPRLGQTLLGYLDQVRVSLRPSTVVGIEAALREFACFLASGAPEVGCVADIRRHHIEAYKTRLSTRTTVGSSRHGGRLSKVSIAGHISALRTCFERLSEWGGDDVPVGVLVFSGDSPILDHPLPRFLDDASAAKLLVAARADPDPFVRLAVEMLARTGMRKGELVNLAVDAVVQIGSSFWLHVPMGKLHNDRYIPLHPQLKELLDGWIARRPAGLRSRYLFFERGRRITASRVDHAVTKVAAAAGLTGVSPHRLRHTLATQAINRGMSLEAIAALLGHRSMRMTMVYARIADRTVAHEYFSVSEKVEALYDQSPRELPADAEGAQMAKLRSEMHRRMLGNGYCARPVGLDCHFESICESCTFFVTTIEFKPTLERQRDDATAKGQVGRQKIFDGLLARLDEEAS
ncbi:MAG: tyrosine-type recombinase/integrase [Acidimicrobiia bacterium]